MDTETKTCSKCGEVKPVDAFSANNTKCKRCKADIANARYKANPEKMREKQKAWREANSEKCSASQKAWRALNYEKVRERRKEYYEANKDKALDYAKKWASSNKEKRMVKLNLWLKTNRDKVKSYNKKYRNANPEKCRANNKLQVSLLRDCYVKTLILRGTQIKEVPQDLIEMKREQVATLSEVKRLIEALKEKQDD